MRPTVLSALLLFASNLTISNASKLETRNQKPKCDEQCAKSIILKQKRPQSYCSSYLRAHGYISTHTKIITRTVTATKSCSTEYEQVITRTGTETYIDASVTITLLPPTYTQYLSTVIVPTGSTRLIDRREIHDRAPAPAQNDCCGKLSECSAKTIAAACAKITPIHTPTVTKTITRTKPCTVTSTITYSLISEVYITSGTLTNFPGAPVTKTVDEVLTTMVPPECAGPFYLPPDDIDGIPVFFPEYPNLPQTSLECCTYCFNRPGCAASAFIAEVFTCEVLMVNSTQPGPSDICPLGVQNIHFVEGDGVVLPGPCGR
ncbi:hypothetical protein TWF694_000724 [Orbilia ellipsospora]|uniref:Apple domain-containing protein n=1 Tax=Orbilia ellipsospora TaxID=2528407 RepID=A0AAV9XPI0_9PEZI